MAACACHFVAFLVSLIFVYFAWTGKNDVSDRYSFNRGSKLNVASMGRSASQNISHTVFWAQCDIFLGIVYNVIWIFSYDLSVILSIPKKGLKDRKMFSSLKI